MKTVPKKHQHEIKAWADGLTIQCQQVPSGHWIDTPHPNFSDDCVYRVKPIPDIVMDVFSEIHRKDGAEFPGAEYNTSTEPNLRLTYNGFTGALKKAEVI